ncbi:MAG: hypothetical protein ACTSV7_07675 [Candidatus Baldrarchaeia archaeon]
MRKDTLAKVTNELKEKYPDIGLNSIEVDDKTGKAIFNLQPKKELAFLEKNKSIISTRMSPQEKAATIRRDAVDRTVLDLGKKDAFTETPEELFKRATRYYYVDPLVGTVTNLLANLSYKGFENDIDDPNIKNFYDTWTFDVNFAEVLEWIYLDFFKVGHVSTYKALAKYEPRVSFLSPIPGKKNKTKKKTTGKEKAAKKNIWSKGHLPVSYTVLNPLLVTIEGSLLFDKYKVLLRPPPELTALLKKPAGELTPDEKELIKALPSDLKAAAEGGGEVALDPRLVGSITYRKQPYERYAKPRTARIFDSIEYKNALREADLSTLDGISNYILKITIGSDEYPVTTQPELEAVAQLFNTPSKSFDVVWNHTLQIDKIVSPEISSILGQEKYAQVNDDMTQGLAITRSIIDGVGRTSAPEIAMMAKGLMEEINYARRQVTRWIYREYQQIAEAVGFDRFPKIRWDEGVLQDVILYMSTISQLVDRRMMSYRTSLEKLGFDYETELQNMTEELPIVEKGIFGILGSPWQQAGGVGGVQPVQKAPTGTPSGGRPKAQPAKPKQPVTEPNKKLKTKTASKMTVVEAVKKMDDPQFGVFLNELMKARVEKDSVEEE